MGNTNESIEKKPLEDESIFEEFEEFGEDSKKAIKELDDILERKAKEELSEIFTKLHGIYIENKFRYYYKTFEKYYKDNEDFISIKLAKTSNISLSHIVVSFHMEIKVEQDSVLIPLIGTKQINNLEEKYLFYVKLSLESSKMYCSFTKYEKVTYKCYNITTKQKFKKGFLKCYKGTSRANSSKTNAKEVFIIIDTKSRIFERTQFKNGFLLEINGHDAKTNSISELKKIINCGINIITILTLVKK